MAELWRFGKITEDKKLPVRFFDGDGDPWELSQLIGYGVTIYNQDGSILLKCGNNIEGFSNQHLIPVSNNEIKIELPGTLLPKKTGKITAKTIILIADPEMTDGIFRDISEDTKLIYKATRDNG